MSSNLGDQLLSHLLQEGIDFDLAPGVTALVAIRNTTDIHSNLFNDALLALHETPFGCALHGWACTTDPGQYYRDNPMESEGVALLPAGFHKDVWSIGLHKGKAALVQTSPVKVERFKDGVLKPGEGKEFSGIFGINIHQAGVASTRVDKWSAGCVVSAKESDHRLLMSLCDIQLRSYPSRKFSLAVLESSANPLYQTLLDHVHRI